MIRLTDKEILEILGVHGYTIEEATDILNNAGRGIAKAQLKKMVEWADSYCTHRQGKGGIQNMPKRYCEECWQALLEETR